MRRRPRSSPFQAPGGRIVRQRKGEDLGLRRMQRGERRGAAEAGADFKNSPGLPQRDERGEREAVENISGGLILQRGPELKREVGAVLREFFERNRGAQV